MDQRPMSGSFRESQFCSIQCIAVRVFCFFSALTNHCELSVWKDHSLLYYSSRGQKYEMDFTGLHSFWRLYGSICFLGFFHFSRLPAFLGSRLLSSSSKPAVLHLPISDSDPPVDLLWGPLWLYFRIRHAQSKS